MNFPKWDRRTPVKGDVYFTTVGQRYIFWKVIDIDDARGMMSRKRIIDSDGLELKKSSVIHEKTCIVNVISKKQFIDALKLERELLDIVEKIVVSQIP